MKRQEPFQGSEPSPKKRRKIEGRVVELGEDQP